MPSGVDEDTEMISEIINGFRRANNKEPLYLNRELTLGAKNFAHSMLPRFEEIEHGVINPYTPPERRHGWEYEFGAFGNSENAEEFAKDAVVKWIEESAIYNKQLLEAQSEMGIGLATHGKRVFLSVRLC